MIEVDRPPDEAALSNLRQELAARRVTTRYVTIVRIALQAHADAPAGTPPNTVDVRWLPSQVEVITPQGWTHATVSCGARSGVFLVNLLGATAGQMVPADQPVQVADVMTRFEQPCR
ncbi:hypothetical protein J5X84_39130 [Streptosporangiaceae bacterium NEAU-GS5]|nr:hypothetical protein [Streptosporangiaceae bacterium NEAU-GS5]